MTSLVTYGDELGSLPILGHESKEECSHPEEGSKDEVKWFWWFFVRYGMLGGPIAIIVGIVQGDAPLIFGAAVWTVVSVVWFLSRNRQGAEQKPTG